MRKGDGHGGNRQDVQYFGMMHAVTRSLPD